jgi:AcrR family transcriptional regulator
MSDQPVSDVVEEDVDRRTAILLAVCRVIARDGVDGLRMAAVAREAGVSSALLHYHFATREELVRHAFVLQDQLATDEAARRIAGVRDPLERIRRLLAEQLSDAPEIRDGWILWSEMQRLAIFHEDLRDAVVDRSLRWVGMVAELIAEAQAAGRIDASIDAAEAALRLTVLVDGLGEHLLIGSVPRAEAQRLLGRVFAEVLGA